MSQSRMEIAVGVFVLAGAACLVYLSLVMGGVGGFNLRQYNVYAAFQTVQGLKVGAPVVVALLLVSVSFGLIARTVPQMNVFIVAMPLKIVIGVVFVGLSLPFVSREAIRMPSQVIRR